MPRSIFSLLLLCFYLVIVDSANAQTILEKNQLKRATSYQRINPDLALASIDSVYRSSKKIDNAWLAQIEISKSKIHNYRGEHDLAITYALKARKFYDETDNKNMQCQALIALGQAYHRNNEFNKSTHVFYDAKTLALQLHNKPMLTEIIIGFGNNNFGMRRNEAAMVQYKQAETLANELKDKPLQAKASNNIANMLLLQGKTEESLKNYRLAEKYFHECNQPLDELMVYYNIGKLYKDNNKLDSANFYMTKCLVLGTKIHSLEDIKYAYLGLSECAEKSGNYKNAFQFMKLYEAYSDSLSNNENKSLIAKLELEYQKKQDKTLIEQQQRELAIRKRDNFYAILGLSVLSLLIILGVVLFLRSKRLNRALQASNVEIKEQNKTIDKALKEREILLKEVHHRVKNSLQIISSLLNLQESQLTDETAIMAINNSKTRIQTIALMHQSLYQRDADLGMVNSSSYLKSILELQLEALSDQYNPVKASLKLVEQELSIDQAVPLGLIASEIINNALKYAYVDAETPLLNIESHSTDNQFELRIEDNGKGFDHQNIKLQYSLGLEIVEALTEQLRGRMECITGKTGTKFIFKFPL